IRADLFTEEICKILKEMNVTRVLLGAESGSDKILKYYRKGQTVQDNQRVIDLCFHYGIELTASFIIGAPVETEEDLLETYNFIKKNSSKFWNVHIDPLDPLPGTEIWNYARNKGLVSDFDEDIKCLKLSEYIKEEKFIECLKAFDYLVSMEVEKHFTLARELMNDVYG
ncbi:MAG TPA: radical SAM protein, partial [Candidatus Eremiobacteraeota bacterium]|nr:radical SAM protein [Candidatus Eremiobacteraeota bacterium]